jgi:ribosomal RNA-processing protein 8
MFSVPGWNVSASVATQTETPKPKDPNKLGKKAQKRKQKQEEQVDAEKIGDYWDKAPGDDVDSTQATPRLAEDAAEDAVNGAQEKKGKKRKRAKKNTQETEDGAIEASIPAETTPQATNATPEVPADKPTKLDTSSKRDKKKRKKDAKPSPTNELSLTTAPVSLIPEPVGLTPLQKSMRAKLASARFRHLNESLYTKPSTESLDLFTQDPSMFEDYHRGFAQQVEVWPENPVDGYVQAILGRGKERWGKKRKETDEETGVKPLPRNREGQATIADLGCGTASLSYRLQPHLTSLNLTIQSFDLSKPTGLSAPLVTVADISRLRLPDSSVDVAIFCLALMGTNWLDFIDEAFRILRWKGELWVAEIKSRFARNDGKKGGGGKKVPINSIGSLKKPIKPKKKEKPEEEGIVGSEDEADLAVHVDGSDPKQTTDVSAFVEVLRKRGFILDAPPERPNDAIDLQNKMFVKMQFVKGVAPVKGKNVRKDAGGEKAKGPDHRGMKYGLKGKKFGIVADEEGDREKEDERERGVLKACLYKIR